MGYNFHKFILDIIDYNFIYIMERDCMFKKDMLINIEVNYYNYCMNLSRDKNFNYINLHNIMVLKLKYKT